MSVGGVVCAVLAMRCALARRLQLRCVEVVLWRGCAEPSDMCAEWWWKCMENGDYCRLEVKLKCLWLRRPDRASVDGQQVGISGLRGARGGKGGSS
eukprot:2908439-Amphidinium_carterae.1